MKKLLFAAFITLMIAGCNQAEKKSDTPVQKDNPTSGNGDEMKTAYEANLATLKTQVAAFEKEDMSAWEATIADNAVWSSPVYEDTISTKAHWVEFTKSIFEAFNNLHLAHAQFLPGLDSTSQKPDGSVRYYGMWTGVSTSGKAGIIKVYGTYDFTDDHKIRSGNDFYDAGGLMNSLKP